MICLHTCLGCKEASCSCQSMNLLTETFGSSLIQNGLNFFFPLPPYSQKQFIVQFLSNLCYLVKEGWEVRGPDRGHVCPVAGATTPLLGMGVLYSAYSVSFNECVRLERSLPAGDQRVALPSRCDVPLHLQDENWMYTNVNGREPFMTVHA